MRRSRSFVTDPQSALEGASGDQPATDHADKQGRLADVSILALAFFLIFIAFMLVQNLATSVLPTNLAFTVLSLLYASFAFSNLIWAAPIVQSLGTRPSLFLASLLYTILDGAYVLCLQNSNNEWIQWTIITPAALLAGFGAAVLWTAQGTYVTRCAPNGNVGKYSGIFFGIMALGTISGPFISNYILKVTGSQIAVFKALFAIGAGGPLVLLFVWSRPEPGVSAETAAPPRANVF
ncbi:major facilitator superfamily domain-containing protein [Zopfochytrium polystomum]|nr:major facilitator superfamily domain-containing protein [Zopfochytrium polystomum]